MTALSPDAPGALGTQPEPQQLLAYLTALGQWLTSRRAELDELDAAVLAAASEQAEGLTGDVRLGLTLWQAIKTRYDAMLLTWDSGRVGPSEREKLATQIWGRLETTGLATGVTGMSVPEAGKLSDALTAQLRQRLQLDPSGSAVTVRLRDLRASVERIRDQVALEPADAAGAAREQVAGLAARVDAVAEKAARGGDVGGLLGPMEVAAATFERDLIVGGALRRQNAGRVAELGRRRDALASRAVGLHDLVTRTVAAVTPAPKYAVPEVDNLGPVPAGGPELDAYADRLDAVGRAMDALESAYQGALTELNALRAALASRGTHPAAGAAEALAGRNPVDLVALRSSLDMMD